ncbi:MAG: hypothetical protein A2Y91_04230 [Chloroflexi bacterium RBG_13_54_8]|nr:MAG: hypothetical protein A2Y91_04230 [Chloroflexi bacterium RBG_13_54_8]
MNLQSHRPPGYTGKGEQYFPRLAQELERTLIKAQRSLAHDTLCLSNSRLEELANVLIEFAEDIHNDIGIWRSLERYNGEFFGIPLPFVLRPNEHMGKEAINRHRIQHLLWVLYSELNPQLILSPTHQDLIRLAEAASRFLEKRFAEIPRGSSVKTFLARPNKFGWEVKRKLLWLGTHSYLFRHSFRNWVEDHGGKLTVPVIDDFVCQQTTAWSGLGVIDVLAEAMDISGDQRSTLRSWFERHSAYYRVLAAEGPKSEVMNLVNNKPYTIRLSDDKSQFEVGTIVFGSLVPWNGEWYWSGEQQIFPNVTEETLQELRDTFLRKVPQIAYRYCNELAGKARKAVDHQYLEFMEYHDSDLAIYPNGLSMVADRQKEIRLQWESKPREEIAEVMEKIKLKDPSPSLSFPHDLIENDGEVGVYYNPDEGQEIMTGFNFIVSGFKKKGMDLTKDEEESIRSFIRSDMVSPKFVRRLIQEYGSESVEAAFLIRGSHDESHIDYLLRRYKGAYYRNRYPRVALL